MPLPAKPFADLVPSSCRIRRLSAGEELAHEGDAFNGRAWLIREGELQVLVECLDGTAILLFRLGPGELVGELGFLGKARRTATVVASADAEVAEIDAEAWRRMARHPAFDARLAAHLFHRYMETHEVVKRLGQAKVVHRLIVYLLGLPVWRETRDSVVEVTLPPHRELAQILRCTRERMTTLLGELAAGGWIERIGRSRYRLDRKRLLASIDRI